MSIPNTMLGIYEVFNWLGCKYTGFNAEKCKDWKHLKLVSVKPRKGNTSKTSNIISKIISESLKTTASNWGCLNLGWKWLSMFSFFFISFTSWYSFRIVIVDQGSVNYGSWDKSGLSSIFAHKLRMFSTFLTGWKKWKRLFHMWKLYAIWVLFS